MKIRNIIAATLAVAAIAVAPLVSYAGTTTTRTSAIATATAAVKTDANRKMVTGTIKAINAVRKENGAAALKENKDLDKAAQVRVDEMIKANKLSHVRPNGSKYSTVCQGLPVGENITRFRGYADAPEVVAVRNWVNSADHFRNMNVRQYTQTGVAFGQAEDGTWYAVQVFGGAGTVTYIDKVQG